MTETQDAKILEATWEEISERAEELKGRRVMVTVFNTPQGANGGNGATKKPQTLAEALEGRTGKFKFGPPDLAERSEEYWGEYVEEKHRRIKEKFAESIACEEAEEKAAP